MSDTVKKYAVVDQATGKTVTTYDTQAPATALAKRRYRGFYQVEERTYALVSKGVVRTVKNGEVLA
jgi:hypothetical protein